MTFQGKKAIVLAGVFILCEILWGSYILTITSLFEWTFVLPLFPQFFDDHGSLIITAMAGELFLAGWLWWVIKKNELMIRGVKVGLLIALGAFICMMAWLLYVMWALSRANWLM